MSVSVATVPHQVRQSEPGPACNVDGQSAGLRYIISFVGGNVQLLRRNPRYLLAALLAFVAQVTLAFAHVHVKHPAPHIAIAPADATLPLPADDDDDCRFCATIHVASTLIPAACPDVVVPETNYGVAPVVSFLWPRLTARSSPFRSRAPPAGVNA
jgi:hypothetical protein